MKRALAILALVASASALAADTDLGALALAEDLEGIASRIEAEAGAKRYVLSAMPDYYYEGDASIPAGYYYRAVTGSGYCRYAARIPVPQGIVALSGAAGDPIIAKFGGEIPVESNGMSVESLSSRETDGQYNVADVVFSPDTPLGLTVLFHCNILNPVPEFSDIAFSPASGSIAFTLEGVQHTCTIMSHSSSGCTYTDAAYDMQSGTWTTASYTLSASFEQSAATGWGFGTFGGAELATKDDLNPEIAKVLGIRTGLDGEYGSGMGYKVYNFASERRYWELHVPNLAVSCPRNTSTSSRTFSSSGGNYYFSTPSLNYPLCATDRFAVGASLTETADAFGTDGCAQAMWRVWIIPANTNNIDGPCTYEITATNRVSAGFLGIAATGGIGPSEYINFAYTNSASRAINYTLSNFRATNLSGTGNSRQIGFTYDVLAVSSGYTCSYTASHTVTITTSTTVNGVVTLPSSLIISDKTHHLMYDDGLKCTWRLEATNGVFYVRKVSGKDYRKEDVE